MSQSLFEKDPVIAARAVRLPRHFGRKHPGKTLGAIVDSDPGYIAFLAGIAWERHDIGDAVAVLRRAYAEKVSRAQNSEDMLRR